MITQIIRGVRYYGFDYHEGPIQSKNVCSDCDFLSRSGKDEVTELCRLALCSDMIAMKKATPELDAYYVEQRLLGETVEDRTQESSK